MNILICDDDKNIILQISKWLNAFSKDRKIIFNISSFECGDDVTYKNKKYDMAFIDIEMPGISGLKLTEHLQQSNSNIIIFIVTSFQGYLDAAMDLKVFRYLSKPLNKNRFIRSIDTAINLYHQSTQKIIIDNYGEYYNVFTIDIIYLAIENRKTKIITKKGDYLSCKPLDYWKKKLANYNYFIQSHYSFIINLKNVLKFNKSEVTLLKNDVEEITVPISRGYYVQFKDAFFNYMGETI